MEVRKQIRVRDMDLDHESDKEQMTQNAGFGELPSRAPLANPYVPFQLENPPKYEARKGLVRGTLYPGLDLPFMGMVNKKPLPQSPMAELQALGFALVELGEYLDTHPDDCEAMELFHSYAELYEKGAAEYQKMCGPLMQRNIGGNCQYDWLKDPWPWEEGGNA